MVIYDLNQLGAVSGAYEAIEATLDVLKLWLPVAVVNVNADGYAARDGVMVVPMRYGRVPTDVVSQVADQVPAVFVSSPGTTGDPVQVGTTGWQATFVINVTLVDRADDWEITAGRIQLWASLIRQVILANRTLRGRVVKVRWRTESYGAIPSTDGRTYAGTTVRFDITLPVTYTDDVGTLTPDPVYPDPEGGLPNPLPDTPVVVAFEEDYEHGPAS